LMDIQAVFAAIGQAARRAVAGLPPCRRAGQLAFLAFALPLFLAACAAPLGYPGAAWRPSPNSGIREPNIVVIHHTGSATLERALASLRNPARSVSSHYLVGKDGTVVQLVDERRRAWHAGLSYWGGDTDLNSSSIGIELVNTGDEPFPEAQIEALLKLLADLKARYKIPTANFVGHGDVAPGRKTDPSAYFPWRRLAASGFGLWCEKPFPTPPEGFDEQLALAALGYDPARPEADKAAFLRHFAGIEAAADDAVLSAEDLARLFCLVQRKAALRQ
jgi:N-acetylmuramoyl-L-alanine amidase